MSLPDDAALVNDAAATGNAVHLDWLDHEMRRLVEFGKASAASGGGFGWLGDDGKLTACKPVELWISCRMTHVFALAEIVGIEGAGALVDHGLHALASPLRDAEYGGWFSAVELEADIVKPARVGAGRDPRVANDRKEAYSHAFVILAASSAMAAGHPLAESILREALDVHSLRFWDEAEGMAAEGYSRDWSRQEDYRGVNANMHTVEAYLAAGDVLGDPSLLVRAMRIVTRVVDGFGRENDWRLPEHFTAEWLPLLDYNADAPAHPFRPFGSTIGHGLERSRLTLQMEQSLIDAGLEAPDWMEPAARSLYDRAVRDGWAADGSPGFVYTVDWDGAPVVTERMHWVAAEAIGAASALLKRTGEARYAQDYETWWAYVRDHLIDERLGSWWHELDANNRPAHTVWQGKPDLYHAVQATLLPRLPLAPALAVALGKVAPANGGATAGRGSRGA